MYCNIFFWESSSNITNCNYCDNSLISRYTISERIWPPHIEKCIRSLNVALNHLVNKHMLWLQTVYLFVSTSKENHCMLSSVYVFSYI